ncbi:MAG: Hpt domain-containing protein [Myxococcales bacterium]|nr:Hpt domain-containing protein [Myxococcales bacterium]
MLKLRSKSRRLSARVTRASGRRLRTTVLQLRALLSNVSSGCATVDPDGVLGPERTAWFDQWFGEPRPGATLFAHLAPLAPEFAARTQQAWAEVREGALPPEVTLGQLPSELAIEECVFRFTYRNVDDHDPPQCVLVVVDDVSAEVAQRRVDQEARELTGLCQMLIGNRTGLEAFVRETTEFLTILDHSVAALPAGLARDLHTLKGNAACFGLRSISEKVHELESELESGGHLRGEVVGQVAERWRRIVDALGPILSRNDVFEVDVGQHAALLDAIQRRDPTRHLLDRVRALTLEPIERRLTASAEQARALASRLGKKVDVVVQPHGVRLDPTRWAPLFPPLVHAIRNAIDHGIETVDERARAGKPALGCLSLRAAASGADLLIEVADDGRGIDVARLVEKARLRGMPIPEDPLELVFASGLSTATAVTEISGRGVGMEAVAEAARTLGGTARIRSVLGVGTTLLLSFPGALTDDEIVGSALGVAE